MAESNSSEPYPPTNLVRFPQSRVSPSRANTPFRDLGSSELSKRLGMPEQQMTGLATGLALEGKTTFTYSIANFATLRCLEQIRNDAAYHGANVNVVCIGGGFSYGALGISHHATEDLAILRSIL